MPITILLIEDDPADALLTRRALQGLPEPLAPAEVTLVSSWSDAHRRLAEGGIDLILLDFKLPGETGLDILHRLAEHEHPPVVMMTGQDDVTTAMETLRAGAADYVAKTAGPSPLLCRTIERVLDRQRLERELAESRARLAAHAADLEHQVEVRTRMAHAQAAQIEELYLRAEEATRLKSEIVKNVSHELRTPLGIILGYADILAEELPRNASPDAHEALTTIRGRAEQLRELIESLLAMGRLMGGIESVHASSFSLARLMDELRQAAGELNSERGLVVEWRVPSTPCEVEHDREKIRVIAYQLVSNAIKFTPEGAVAVTAERTPEGGVVLSVTDTGIGVPGEARNLVFEDFRQLDGSSTRRYGGLGLGLGIVKRYTDLLRGTVLMESTPGRGTTITVQLPACVRRSDAPATVTH